MKRTAEVKRDAAIGEAEARKDAGIKVMFDWLSNQPISFLVGRGKQQMWVWLRTVHEPIRLTEFHSKENCIKKCVF